MELQIEISISDYHQGGSFRLSDRITIKDDFAKMSAILAKYHKLTEEFKESSSNS